MKKLFLAIITILIVPAVSEAVIQEMQVSNHTSAAVNISWITDAETTGEIHYSESSELLNPKSAYDKRGSIYQGCTHYVDIKNLKKDATYYFEVVSSGETDDNSGNYYTFKTMKETFSPPGTCLIFGKAFQEDGSTAAEGAIVYFEITHNNVISYPRSALINSKGDFHFTVREARSTATDDLFGSFTKDHDPIHLRAVYCGNIYAYKDLVFEGCTQNCGSMSLSYSETGSTTTIIPGDDTSAPPPNPAGGGGGGGGGDDSTPIIETECTKNSDCDDNKFCNGSEICESGRCIQGNSPCNENEACYEAGDECIPVNPVPGQSCSSDAECDNGLFCDGAEKCVEGVCAAGSQPCGPDEMCIEDVDTCWSSEIISALSMKKVLKRPFIRRRKCTRLVLTSESDHHFDKSSSTITLSGPEAGSKGVVVDTGRDAFKAGGFIFIPICIDKDAAIGQWKIRIETSIGDPAKQYEEGIEAGFEVK